MSTQEIVVNSYEAVEQDISSRIVDGKDSGASFDEFPYYLDEKKKVCLANAGYVNLKLKQRNPHKLTSTALCTNKEFVVLRGPTGSELYLQTLARALAHKFQSKLMILDGSHFGWTAQGLKYLSAIGKVLETVTKTCPLVLYFRDVQKMDNLETYSLLKGQDLPVLVLGSAIGVKTEESKPVLHKVPSYCINIRAPEDKEELKKWKTQLDKDIKTLHAHDTREQLTKSLASFKVECTDLASISIDDQTFDSSCIDHAITSAITESGLPENEKLVISAKNLAYWLKVFSKKKAETKAATGDNKFEQALRNEVVPAGKIGVKFEDIGALDNVKESLLELVMLPLQRPELFQTGGLIKPCKGVLLFGPPGTGKTMLAKAVAGEAGASFINVSMASISSMWHGESEKYVKAIFTLALKVAPTIIFIDEVDSFLGRRSSEETEVSRKMKNEFMSQWDGLLSNCEDRFLVLAATNRPFDLDEAIIRRFQRRVMVGLPDANNREKIFRTILSKVPISDDIDFTELSRLTEGYSGSDLKNLCIAAAYRPLRELLKAEKEKTKSSASETKTNEQQLETAGGSTKTPVSLRPLRMEDVKEAKKEISASSPEGMKEIESWNELYGEGGSRKPQLSYFM